jgi:protein phosphatase
LIISHVGDSRAYLFTSDQLVRLTRDQTMAQLLADIGVIKDFEVDTHHSRHVLTSAITATGDKAEVELHHVMLADGDQLVLCSDGLTEMVSDTELADVLKKKMAAADTCQELVELALAAGGKDNITIVVARYRIPSE